MFCRIYCPLQSLHFLHRKFHEIYFSVSCGCTNAHLAHSIHANSLGYLLSIYCVEGSQLPCGIFDVIVCNRMFVWFIICAESGPLCSMTIKILDLLVFLLKVSLAKTGDLLDWIVNCNSTQRCFSLDCLQTLFMIQSLVASCILCKTMQNEALKEY